jgi:hypothetical protein
MTTEAPQRERNCACDCKMNINGEYLQHWFSVQMKPWKFVTALCIIIGVPSFVGFIAGYALQPYDPDMFFLAPMGVCFGTFGGLLFVIGESMNEPKFEPRFDCKKGVS